MKCQNWLRWIACPILAFTLASCSSPTKTTTGDGDNTGIEDGAITPDNEGDIAADTGTPEVRLENVGGYEYGTWSPVHFDYDSAAIRADDRHTLEEIAAWMKQNPGKKIMIAGNCDERGTTEYNLALGQRRASSARAYLVRLGAPAKDIGTISYGEERPVDPAHNNDAWAKNRRDEFGIQK